MIGAALLLFISSFFTFLKVTGTAQQFCNGECSTNSWETDLFPILPSIHLSGLIGAGLILAARFLPEGRKILGLALDQWGTPICVFAAWNALWSLGRPGDGLGLGIGAVLSVFFALVLAALAILRTQVPWLAIPLLPAPRPQPMAPPFGAAPAGGYGYPAPGGPAPFGAPVPGPGPAAGPTPGPEAGPMGGSPTPPPAFAPFWFAVPANRPLYPEDGTPGAPVGELTPGVWYLAVDQRGPALVAQLQDGRRGLLQDTSGLQRG